MNKTNKIEQSKKAYNAPRLTVHGDATQLTQKTAAGTVFDRAFGAPVTDPTLVLS